VTSFLRRRPLKTVVDKLVKTSLSFIVLMAAATIVLYRLVTSIIYFFFNILVNILFLIVGGFGLFPQESGGGLRQDESSEWFSSMLGVVFNVFTLFVGWQEGHSAFTNPCHLS